MSDYAASKRQELLEKIARERLARGGGEKRVGADGRTLLKPTFGERMVLTGFGNIDASDEMSEIQKIMKGMKSTQDTESYVESNIDKYPGLKDYDTTKGKASAIKIVETEDALQKGDDYLETTGYSKEALGLDPEKRYEVSTYVPLVTKANEEKAAKLRKPQEDLAAGQLALQETIAKDSRAAQEERARFQRHQLEVEGIRAENARRERQFEAAQNRQLTKEQNMMQLKLANMDRADRREERRMEREDREADKRKESIMMLIRGLTQLGAGFVI